MHKAAGLKSADYSVKESVLYSGKNRIDRTEARVYIDMGKLGTKFVFELKEKKLN